MHPLDIDASPYILHTVCYSSRPKEPLIPADDDTNRNSIFQAQLFVLLAMCP